MRFGQQLYQPPKDTIRGVDPDTWYSPLQPVQPIAPEGTEPRGFQYWAGQNLLWTPRSDAEYSAADLKQLAQYPLARICIENIKDLISDSKWEIQLKPKPGERKKDLAERAKGDATLVKLSRFWERPDREHSWPEWLRPLLEDLLVIDAATILIRKTFKGEIVELPVLRGDSIVRYIDVNGFTPMPPQPAYAQNWWGIPLVNLSTDQLIYKPRNIVPRNTVSSQLYGMAPTEQLATEIKIGMQRLQFTLDYYTEGSIPGVIQVVPRGTSPEKISEAMQWMNSELAGNLAARRQWRMVQGFNEPGHNDQIEFTKEPLLADLFDEVHIRKICFGYGTSPQRLMKMMNRASSQQMDESADIEGLRPWVNWLKSVIDYIVQYKMGLMDYEITFDLSKEPDPEKEAKALTEYSSKGVLTSNEVRDKIGEEPRNEPEADMLGVVTGQGFVPIGMAAAVAGSQTDESGKTSVKDKGKGGKDGASDGNASHQEEEGSAGGDGKGNKRVKPNGNGSAASKAHCGEHSAYDDTCLGCSQQEIRRLEKQAAPLSAVSSERVAAAPKGAIGFAAPSTINVGIHEALVRGQLRITEVEFDKQHKYASTQIDIPAINVPLVLGLGKDLIAEDDLASHGRETHPHVTVRFGVVDDADKLREVLKDFKSFKIRLGLTRVFDPGVHSEGACPVVVDIESDELLRLNAAIEEALAEKTNDFEYHPHMTLAYVKPEAADKYRDLEDFKGIEFVIDAVTLSSKDDTTTVVPLTKLAKQLHHPHQRPEAVIHPGRLTPHSHIAKHDVERVLHNAFHKMSRKVSEQLHHELVKFYKKTAKASKTGIRKADEEDTSRILSRILKALKDDWMGMPDELQSAFESATLSGALEGAVQLSITDKGMLGAVNQVARDWAVNRAAELVGMKRNADGNLTVNPNAKWVISDTTRDDIRKIITDAFEKETTTTLELDALIRESGTFSDTRASMIARTEISRAQSVGNLTTWQESGLVNTVEWEVSGDHDQDDECDENEGNSPYPVDEVPDHPAHPNCDCILIAGEIEEV